MIRILRQYLEDGLSDLGDYRNMVAYPVGEDGGAEIEMTIRGQQFLFYIEPGSDRDPNKACGVMAVTDNIQEGPKIKGPIDPQTWVRISAFVRERLGAIDVIR
jgi:hypothetical protein